MAQILLQNMRIDSCRKCGAELREYDYSERCQACGREFTQFACVKCQTITEPQYHVHAKSNKGLEIIVWCKAFQDTELDFIRLLALQ